MQKILFNQLQFSQLFTEFIAENPIIHSHFPAQQLPASTWHKVAESFNGRNELKEAIIATMSHGELSPSQTENLQTLSNPETLAVVTGQQVGFLGGAMYTLLKAHSTVQYAKQISTEMSLPIIPIFWIEDNDADSAEAAKATVLSQKNELLTINCTEEITNNIPVSERVFGDEITQILDTIEATVQQSEFTADLILQLRNIYQSGTSWSVAFTQLLQLLLAETGILFISAAVARKQGLFGKIIRKEIEESGASKRIIDQTSSELEKADFHVQAVASDVNLFYHDGNKRLKLRLDDKGNSFVAGDLNFSREQLLEQAENSPELFSPNVLLRPIVQDSIIPTIAYVAGPGEIAYLSQLHSAYEHFNVQMPIIKPRHSATLLPPSTVRFLEKNSFSPEFFMRPWHQIEKDLTEHTADSAGEPLFTSVTSTLAELFAEISHYTSGIDQSLVGAVNAALRNTEKQIEDLQKKINSAQKKRHTALFDKSYETSVSLMPFGELQERVLSPISFGVRFGNRQLTEIIHVLTENTPNAHFIVPINFTHINQ